MFHILFEPRAAEALNAAMDLELSLEGEIVVLNDDLSLGPLSDLETPEGRQARTQWLVKVTGADPAAGSVAENDGAALQQVLDRMVEEEFDQIWLWVAPNAKDLTGYFALTPKLAAFSGRIFIVSLNNLPFINEKGAVFYPTSLADIPAREFVKARKLTRMVTPAEFETDPDEWTLISQGGKNLRIWEGSRKLKQEPDDFYDERIRKSITGEWQKANRIVHQSLAKTERMPADSFVHWRLNEMQHAGLLEKQGEGFRLAGSNAGPAEPVALGELA